MSEGRNKALQRRHSALWLANDLLYILTGKIYLHFQVEAVNRVNDAQNPTNQQNLLIWVIQVGMETETTVIK